MQDVHTAVIHPLPNVHTYMDIPRIASRFYASLPQHMQPVSGNPRSRRYPTATA